MYISKSEISSSFNLEKPIFIVKEIETIEHKKGVDSGTSPYSY